jgi:hypothetical protein
MNDMLLHPLLSMFPFAIDIRILMLMLVANVDIVDDLNNKIAKLNVQVKNANDEFKN